MSHITSINIEIRDLNALEAAATELGGTLRRGQQTYAWYGYSVGDHPLPEGFTQNDLGKCEHAIHLPNCKYEIGVARNPKTSKLTLLYDCWGPGEKLEKVFGRDLKKLTQLYGVHAATIAARKKGYIVQRQQNGSKINLLITA